MNHNDQNIRQTVAGHFAERWVRGYVQGKLRFDPVYRATFCRLQDSTLPLLDIGCGLGLLTFYLRECGFTPPILGVDVDAKKIKRGAEIATRHYPDVTLQASDGVSLPDFSGHVSLLDVLHYIPAAEQAQVLGEAARRVAPGGWCIIRTTPRDESWRFRFTQWEEWFCRAISWMSRPAVDYPTLNEIQAFFPKEEFAAEVRPLWGSTPFNSWLLALRRLG